MKFRKGDIVLVKASVYTKERVACQSRPSIDVFPKAIHTPKKEKIEGGEIRGLMQIRYIEPFEGMVVGWSTRLTGLYQWGHRSWDVDDPGYLAVDKTHKVVMIQPTDTHRWVKPMPCLEEDLEIPRPGFAEVYKDD